LSKAFDSYGVSCFVAHHDIQPTKDWQDEIETALFSMDGLLALMTQGFSDSEWTDQEIGVAMGRRVPIISVRLPMDPYGFIGRYQGLPGGRGDPTALAKKVYDLLWENSPLKARLAESLVARFEKSQTYAEANALMSYLERIEHAPPQLIERLENAPQGNSQVRGAYDVTARLPNLLNRLRGE